MCVFYVALDNNPAGYFEGQLFVNDTYFIRTSQAAYVWLTDEKQKKYIFDASIKFYHDFLCFFIIF